MKRGSKFFLVTPEQESAGPFPWTLVRAWRGLGWIAENVWVCLEGGETWQALYDFPELMALPASAQKAQRDQAAWDAERQFIWPSTPTQHAYLRYLNCPFASDALDFDDAFGIIRTLVDLFPHLEDPAFEAALAEDANYREDWRNLPPTEKQVSYLTSVGIHLGQYRTRGEASALIAPASAAQRRRLQFYGVDPARPLSKEDASEMIDDHISQHPESEEQYQQWKKDNGFR